MKLDKLKLRGAIGIKKHMGMDEIELDFSNLSGLVAFSGPNGMGKTTTLDNMHPYRCLGSRSQALIHSFFLPDSYRELSFYLGSDHFRSVIKMNPKSGRGEAFLYLNHAEKSMVKGLFGDYDRAIEEIMGSETLFFNSAFCAQGSKKLSDLRTGELKALMSEFLKLDRYIQHEKTAGQCATIIAGRADGINAQLRDLQRDADSIADTEQTVDAINKLITERTAAAESLRRQIAAESARLKTTEAAQAETERTRVDIANLQAELNALTVEIEGLKRKSAAEFKEVVASATTQLRQKLTASQAEIDRISAQAEQELSGIRAQAIAAKSCLATAEEAVAIADQVKEAQKAIEEARSALEPLQRLLAEKTAEKEQRQKEAEKVWEKERQHSAGWTQTAAGLDEKIEAARQAVAATKAEISAAETRIAELNKNVELENLQLRADFCRDQTKNLGLRDPECKSLTCSFIVSAVEAKQKLEDLEKQIESKKAAIEDEKKQVRAQLAELNAVLAKQESDQNQASNEKQAACDQSKKELEAILAEANAITNEIGILNQGIESVKGSIAPLEQSIRDNTAMADRATEVAVAQEKVASLRQEKERLINEGLVIKRRWDGVIAEKQTAHNALQAEYEEVELTGGAEGLAVQKKWDAAISVRQDRVTALTALIEERKTTIDETLSQQIEALQQAVDRLQKELSETSHVISRENARLAVAQQNLATKKTIDAKIQAKTAERDALMTEASEWLYLKNANSKDGMRALEIDSVAPAIAGYANSLLHTTFGTSESIEIVTQDEKGKEVLEIMVHTADGSRVPIELYSGGEKVWLLKAARLALTMTSKERSGRIIDTCFADEEDGALDPENAKQFVGLYREFMTQGRFNTGFFISHKPECVNLADYVVKFDRGGITIQ